MGTMTKLEFQIKICLNQMTFLVSAEA